MKYMLLMNGTQADFDWYMSWSKEELAAHTGFMHTFNDELIKSGKFVMGEGLAIPQEARIVRAGKRGEPVTDGVFPESKEFLAGFWIVEVTDAEEAYRLAARISNAPGNKARGTQPIEVRKVASGPPA